MSITDEIIMHQRELELRFCAAALQYPPVIRDQGWLRPEQFRDVTLRDFWAALLAGKDSTQVAIELKLLRRLSGLASTEYIGLSQVEGIARAIADDGYKVEVSENINVIAGLLTDGTVEQVRAALAEMETPELTQAEHGVSALDTSLEFMASLDEEPDVIKTGIGKIDNTFGGWSRKSLAILAARPSMGKTALALQFARAACDAGKTALYYSLEMSRRQLWSRMVMGEAKLDHRLYKSRKYTDDERARIVAANIALVDWYAETLIIDDRSSLTSAEIWQGAKVYKPDLIIVDHLALLSDEGDNQNYRIGAITKTGKAIAKEFNCACMYLCQLSRGIERRDDKIPTMSDLRDSGEIEQNADTVVFIHRPDYYESKPVIVSPTQVVIAKDREGARNVNYSLQYHLIDQKFYEEAK